MPTDSSSQRPPGHEVDRLGLAAHHPAAVRPQDPGLGVGDRDDQVAVLGGTPQLGLDAARRRSAAASRARTPRSRTRRRAAPRVTSVEIAASERVQLVRISGRTSVARPRRRARRTTSRPARRPASCWSARRAPRAPSQSPCRCTSRTGGAKPWLTGCPRAPTTSAARPCPHATTGHPGRPAQGRRRTTRRWSASGAAGAAAVLDPAPGPAGARDLRGPRLGRQGRRRSSGSPSAPARAPSGWWRCPSRRSASAPSGTSSATSSTCPAAGEMVLFDRVLVQPLERRVGDGLLHRGGAPGVPAQLPGVRADAGAVGHRGHQVLVLGVASRSSAGGSRPATPSRSSAGSSPTWTWPSTSSTSATRWPRTRPSSTPTSSRRPGTSCPSDDKRAARLNCISHLLSQFDYEDVAPPTLVELPEMKPDPLRAPAGPRADRSWPQSGPIGVSRRRRRNRHGAVDRVLPAGIERVVLAGVPQPAVDAGLARAAAAWCATTAAGRCRRRCRGGSAPAR